MTDIIKLLPDSIANQIAAGEVVQRPASVVKELLENSLDARANQIVLRVREAGKSSITVVDNGCGMSLTDARMSFERHATSKIQNAQDLFHIRSMGFRGEALASIAAVAHVELKTRREEDEVGTKIVIEGSNVKEQEPESMNVGTSVTVKNLFYNIPARRNFLKSNPVELRHINDEFFRVALAHPEIAFEFYQNDQEQYILRPGKLSQRIVQLFGKNYAKQLIPCDEETPDIHVSGYVGTPEGAKKTRGEQFFYVNNRFIKSPYLHHAVANAYEGMVQKEQHPFYTLFIEMDPEHIDINVHPTKTEVKFDDDRLLYGVISAAVKQSLSANNVAPPIDFSVDVNFNSFIEKRESQMGKSDRDYSNFRSIKDLPNADNWELLYQSASSEDQDSREKAIQEANQETKIFQSSPEPTVESEGNNITLHLHGRYLARQIKSGMVLVDQQAAHERILYERYIGRFKSGEGTCQSLLFPQQLEFSQPDFNLVLDIEDEIRKLGFDFEQFGSNSFVINGVPPETGSASEKEVFEGIIEQYKFNKSELGLSTSENLARSLAKRTSIKPGHRLKELEINQLFDQLFACQQPNFTPDGKSTFVVLGLDQLAGFFNAS